MFRHALLLTTLAATPLAALSQHPDVPGNVQRLAAGDAVDRSKAVRTLGALGDRAKLAVPALVQSMGDRDPFVARDAVGALCQIGPVAVPALVQALSSGNTSIRHRA